MITGAREVPVEVDQPLRIGAVGAVDRLVVVAHAEHAPIGAGQQSDEQPMGRCQILELVVQQQPAATLRG